jgi:hypothetical protein
MAISKSRLNPTLAYELSLARCRLSLPKSSVSPHLACGLALWRSYQHRPIAAECFSFKHLADCPLGMMIALLPSKREGIAVAKKR